MKKTTTRVRKVPIKSFTEKPHTNFADEISGDEDKLLDRIFYGACAIEVIALIILIIINIK